jgi:hypothetical protein
MNNEDLPEMVQLDMELVKTNIPSYSNEKLCEMIVSSRYFGFGEDKIAPLCMEELSKRRVAGDPFDFETYIDKSYKELPVFDLNINIKSTIEQAMSIFKKLSKK